MRELLPLALLGGVLGLDVVCFPQMMFSRPLVAATLAGAFVGDATMGILVGVTLELIALATLPFGASRYPEWGSAAVVGGAIAGAMHTEAVGTLTVAVLAALATAWVGGMTLVRLRLWNAWLARRRRPALDAGSRGAVISLQLAGLTADFVRAALLTTVAYALLFPVAQATLGVWTLSESLSRGFVVSAAAGVAGAAAWTIFHSARGARWYFAGGLLVGLLVLFVR
ncbi:MAG: phosphotransferase system sorbose-specific subunit [Gemmatimonadetes bacterium]|nr:phosphotransferase system sorbose-specific subunit [Gemmatimonadota bacterium]